MRKAPILERIGGRPPSRLDIGDDLDGRGYSGAGRHPSPSIMRSMKIAHITAQHDRTGHEQRASLGGIVVGDVDIGVDEPQRNEHPGQQHEQEIGLARQQGEDREHIEQDRQFELALIGVRQPLDRRRPARFAQPVVAPLHLPSPRRRGPHTARPEQQHEREHDLDEQRSEDGLDAHGSLLGFTLAVRPRESNRRAQTWNAVITGGDTRRRGPSRDYLAPGETTAAPCQAPRPATLPRARFPSKSCVHIGYLNACGSSQQRQRGWRRRWRAMN